MYRCGIRMVGRAVCLLLAALWGLCNGLSTLEPQNGSYLGTSVDFSTTTVSSYLTTTGVSPVIWDVFVSVPLNSTTTSYMQQVLPQIAAANAICLLTVEPFMGLSAVTPAVVQELATYIMQYEQAGASFMVRYAHEMNGNWFIWGQQPKEYIQSHQMVTSILRNSTCGVAMVWGPNSATGGGYPWSGAYAAGTAATSAPVPGSANFKLMDTNNDGNITYDDDPYLPFYPGDAWVDWVGMSSFHFGGLSYPFVANQEAAPGAFTASFTGSGLNNFYSRFCNDTTHNKPMVITETSAMYNPSNPQGSTNFAIKQNWWQQVFNVQGNSALGLDISANFPRIRAIMWFDELKPEPQAGNAIIDWRYSGVQQIRSAFAVYILTPAKSNGKTYWLQLSDFIASSAKQTCSANSTSTATANSTAVSNSTAASNSTTSMSSTVQGGRSSSQTTTPAAQNISSGSPSAITGATNQQNAASTVQTTTGAQSSNPNSQTANLAGLIGRRRSSS